MSAIYLDYHATTPVDPHVLAQMLPWFSQDFGNPSSNHSYGYDASKAVRQAATQVASLVGALKPQGGLHTVVFTSGATESINLAIKGFAAKSAQPCRIALMALEHKAVLDSSKYLEQTGQAELKWLKVDSKGRLELAELENVLASGVDLLVVMAANNEIGTCYPLEVIGQLTKKYGVSFFCDASQAAGKIPLEFEAWGIDLMALTAHKFYGPKGSGALIVRSGLQLQAQIHGGGHQQGLRSGTLNVPGIVGLGAAAAQRQAEMQADETQIAALRDAFQAQLQAAIPELVVNGDTDFRLPGNLHIAIPGLANHQLLAQLAGKLAFSTTSACNSALDVSSHVLCAIGQNQELMRGALRLSLGKPSTAEQVEAAATALIEAYQALKAKQNALV